MKRALFAAAALSSLAAAAFVVAPGIAADTPNATPQHGDDFQLTDHTRFAEHLYYYGYSPAIVLMSREDGSAFSKAASQALEKLNAAYAPKGVVVWSIDSKLGVCCDAVAAEAQALNLKVPVLIDEL